jgi:outer membrane receptor protein involved in Fe transport
MRTITRSRLLVFGATATIALIAQAWAEVQPQTAAKVEGNDSAAAADTLQAIVVTGSRVITNGNDSPTPVTLIRTEDLMKFQPTTLADALNELPVFSGSKNQASNPIGLGAFGGGNPSANQLNLRNLGLTDTLLLMDGQRLVPTLITGTLDVDLIPDMLIQRVDMVTGGVSAVYGSDAVAGVVNYVTDKNFNGVKVEAQGGVSNYGDDQSYKMGIAGGTSLFDGRAHIEGSVQRYTNAGILQATDRPYGEGFGVPGTGTASNPYTLLSNLRSSNSTYGGLITSGPLKGYTFQGNGIATPFVNGTPTGTPTTQIGGDGALPDPSLVAPEQMNQFFGRFDMNFTDNFKGHLQAIYSDKKDYQEGNGFVMLNYKLPSNDPFLSSAQQAQLSAAGPTFNFSKTFSLDDMPRIKSFAETEQAQFNAGLEGKLGKYDWSTNLNYGRSALYNTQFNNFNLQNLSAALNATINPASGQVVCSSTLTNPTANPGCVPLNPFGPTAASPSATNYITGDTHYTAVYDLYDANAQISGPLFNTWAGPVVSALSLEWHQLTFQSSTDAPSSELQNCTGLPYNCSPTSVVWQNSLQGSPQVHQTVSEAALEFNVPLLSDKFLAKSLSVDLAARGVSYSTVGTYFPYKFGPEWRVTDDFRLRGTYSRDISALTLYELFQPTSVTLQTLEDLLTKLTYTTPSYNEGNPQLKAQVAHTRTLGFVWQPQGTGFSISSDWYHITIDHYILQVNPYQNQFQQACYLSGGSSPFCSQIIRPSYTDPSPTNLVTSWIADFVNIGSLETWGDDLEMNYGGRVMDHRFNIRLLASYQPHLIYKEAGNDTYDLGGVANGPTPLTATPSVRATGIATLGVTNELTLTVAERWRNPMKLTGNVTGIYAGNVFVPNHVAAIGYTDLNVSYQFGGLGNVETYLNIGNLFNSTPPPATLTINQNGPGPGFASSDDEVGRYFIVGLRAKF